MIGIQPPPPLAVCLQRSETTDWISSNWFSRKIYSKSCNNILNNNTIPLVSTVIYFKERVHQYIFNRIRLCFIPVKIVDIVVKCDSLLP